MLGRKTSRGIRSANTDSNLWDDRNMELNEVKHPPYSISVRLKPTGMTRPFTAPMAAIDVGDVDSITSRLARPNTSSARKSVLWSKPRKEYEFNYEVASNLKNPVLYWSQFPKLQKHYPGTWRTAGTEELSSIVMRLSKPTAASESRKDDCVSRRLYVQAFKEKALSKDIGIKIRIKPRPVSDMQNSRLPPLVIAPEPEKDDVNRVSSTPDDKINEQQKQNGEIPADFAPEKSPDIDKDIRG